MPNIVYVDGRYLPSAYAQISINDRGLQFSDGVYELIYFKDKKFIDGQPHFERLLYSLDALSIVTPFSYASFCLKARHLMSQNHVTEGLFYLQVTRGVCARQHVIPQQQLSPTVIMTIKPWKMNFFQDGATVLTMEDLRWQRCDIKSTSLLGNILGKTKSDRHAGKEIWFTDSEGIVREGGASNAWIIKNNTIITHPLNAHILSGVTRSRVLKLATENNLKVLEKPFSLEEAYQADEAFLTSTSNSILPVTRIDEKKIGKGKVGPITQKLQKAYQNFVAVGAHHCHGE